MVGGASRRLQRSTVKATYARNRRGASWGAHGVYLARDGAQRAGEKGRGFDAESSDLDVAQILRGWQAAGDERLWKFIVSPEHAASLDLPQYTRGLVKQMERDLGSRLEWIAVDHYNTDNPHVHLLVRGRDDHGRPLSIHRDYLKSGLRVRSQELATRALGLRSEREILASRGRAVERTQFTEIDRALLRRADGQRLVTYDGPRPRTRHGQEARLQEMRRLQFLETVGLAEKVGSRTWRLSAMTEPALRQAQLAGDIIKSRARHLAHLSDPRLPLVVTTLAPGVRLTGRVVGTGLADELRDRRYLLLEGSDGRLHYVVQPPELQRARGAGQVRVGDVITLSEQAIERGGRHAMETRVTVQPAKTGPTGRPTERARARPDPGVLPSLKQVERAVGRALTTVPAIDGLIYRGRFVGYARGRGGQRHAVVDTGRELLAIPTDNPELEIRRDVRATSHELEEDGRRRLTWRLGNDEHEQQRERTW